MEYISLFIGSAAISYALSLTFSCLAFGISIPWMFVIGGLVIGAGCLTYYDKTYNLPNGTGVIPCMNS
jgi:hypothetical protein